MSITASTAQVAEALDLTTSRVGQLARKGILVKLGRNRFDLVQSTQGYLRFLRDGTDDTLTPADERAKLLRVQRKLKELELAAKNGSLVPVEQIGEAWSRVTAGWRQNLIGVPARIAPYLVGKNAVEIEGELSDALRTACGAIADSAGN
mgnify:CR=1 FL=1